jgi:hypothetical protein
MSRAAIKKKIIIIITIIIQRVRVGGWGVGVRGGDDLRDGGMTNQHTSLPSKAIV